MLYSTSFTRWEDNGRSWNLSSPTDYFLEEGNMKKIFISFYKIFHPFIVPIVYILYFYFVHGKLLDMTVSFLGSEKMRPHIESILLLSEILILYCLYRGYKGMSAQGLEIGIRSIRLRDLSFIFILALFAFALGELVRGYVYSINFQGVDHQILSQALNEEVTIDNMMSYTNGDNLLKTVLLQPIIEEAIYRFLIIVPFKSTVGKIYALSTSTLVFALSHGISSPIFISLIIDGCFAFFLVHITKNIVSSIVYHISSNLITTLFLVFSLKFPILKIFKEAGENQYMVFQLPLAFLLPVMVAGILVLAYFFRQYKEGAYTLLMTKK